VDETVESLAALSPSASMAQQQQHNQNWAVVLLPGSSSVFGGDGSSISNGSSSQGSLGRGGLPEVASSLSVSLGLPSPSPVGGEGGGPGGGVAGTSTGGGTTGRGGGKGGGNKERSGLTRKSRSKGVSLRSEGSRSDYAVFI
jgi:axial budding pattern protein 2